VEWPPGAEVEYRDVRDGQVWWRTPVRIVENSDECVALWWPVGTKYQRLDSRDRLSTLEMRASKHWQLTDETWQRRDCLLVIPDGASYAVWPVRDSADGLTQWYFNLQAQLKRTAIGFDTDDRTLDLVAAEDLSTWSWKDEDELLEAIRIGLYSDDEVEMIRSAGNDVVALIERADPLFARWANWRAEPSWPVPSLR
jgi:predicted RNA-binding protein associated with RNAse of E/G family